MAPVSESPDDPSPSSAAERLQTPWFSADVHDLNTDSPVVKACGEVDMVTAPQLAKAVTEVLEGSPRRLVFDLTDATFLDSSGIKVLLYALRGLLGSGSVVLRRPQRPVRKVLEITDIADLFVIED